MARKSEKNDIALPMLKTVEQMSRLSGIGENKLRDLMDKGELEYVQNGNRRLIADTAIWIWYNRAKIAVKSTGKGEDNGSWQYNRERFTVNETQPAY